MHSFPEINTTKRILVIGDVMLDEYLFGVVERISPEAPVPILTASENDSRPGGAANVAANIAGIGVSVSVLGICGNDQAAKTLTDLLEAMKVEPLFLKSSKVNTIKKKRIVAHHQQLMRIDEETVYKPVFASELHRKFLEIYQDYDVIVMSDYGKGTLENHQLYIKACNKKNLPVLIDPKGGDFDRYYGATLITPNLREFEEIMGPSVNDEEFINKVAILKERLALEFLIITLGIQGVLLLDNDLAIHRMKSEAKQVYDVSGAGDTVIAVLAALIVNDCTVKEALNMANTAAGLAVAKMGTSVVTVDLLTQEFPP